MSGLDDTRDAPAAATAETLVPSAEATLAYDFRMLLGLVGVLVVAAERRHWPALALPLTSPWACRRWSRSRCC
jgi:hypothetical protein